MSRFIEGDDGDEYAVLSLGRWLARRNKVLGGRPGKAALRDLERALVNLPHKALIESSLCDGKGVCAMGVWGYQHFRDLGFSPRAAWAKLKQLAKSRWQRDTLENTADFGVNYLGITRTLAEVVAWVNDEDWGWNLSPERRYSVVLSWTRQHMAQEAA